MGKKPINNMTNQNGGNHNYHGGQHKYLREDVHDTYKMTKKLKEPTYCGECGAVYKSGKWVWAKERDGHEITCPACHRTKDHYPAGILKLSGTYFQQNRDEIMNLVGNVEERQKKEHPLKRIIAIEKDDEDGITTITTTELHLCRGIADAIESAHKGELDYQYSKDGDILHMNWKRD